MKRLKFYDKFVFFLNIIFAIVLLLAYVLPFIPPKVFPSLSVLSLAIGPLILVNILFFLYWLFKVRRQMMLSLVIIAIGFVNLSSFYKFSESKDVKDPENIAVMTYNVKSFNRYNWIKKDGLNDSITQFIKTEKPHILAVQEYFSEASSIDSIFPYRYIKTKTASMRFGQALFSEFPIINSGSVDFNSSGNNAIFIDVMTPKDTIRVYNVHLESLRIQPQVKELQEEGSERLLTRMGKTFIVQQEQIQKLLIHIKKSPHPIIICGDLNNSAFSYVYKELRGDRFIDAFKRAGNGFGRSFDLNFFPLRIDFILVENNMKVNSFNSYHTIKYSDHFPQKASIKL